MQRTLTVILLTIVALALLAGAVMKSRSIPLEGHIAYSTLGADLERLAEDYETFLESLQTAWSNQQRPGEAGTVLRSRIIAGLAGIRSTLTAIPAGEPERERIASAFSRLNGSIATMDSLVDQLLRSQTAFGEQLETFRAQGAEVVRQLRANGRGRMATDISQLMSATIDATRSDAGNPDNDIPFLLVTLNRDLRIDSRVPSATASLLDMVESILELKSDADGRLYQIGVLPIVDNTLSVGQAAAAGYEDAVASTELARALLSIYVIVLLLVVGFIGWRLRNSYHQLNRVNEELGELNESLEQRVDARTSELSDALTDLKESQVQLVQAEKMSSLGQLVAGISHEINTPLLYLSNNAELTQERVEILNEFVRFSAEALCVSRSNFADSAAYQAHLIKGLKKVRQLLREHELEATVEDLVDLNRDNIEGLADLSNMAQSLKDFSRLDRAPIDSFDVNAGIEKTLTIARNIVKQKAEVVKEFGDLPAIECSPSKINQVFLNIITNAAQAIEDYGEITISTSRRGKDRVVIAIRDNGCGIPPENLPKIRDPFFTTKEVGSGTGLGLSIVDDIVRSHGGELLVESQVGIGSTFSVVLPVQHPGAAHERDADAILAKAG